MTERGPIDKPTLVTSFAEFQRIFGGYLDKKDFKITIEDIDIYMNYLPYAVEGFFANGGQRAYITRVAVADLDDPDKGISNGFIPVISTISSNLSGPVNSGDITIKIPSNSTISLNSFNDFLLLDGSKTEFLKAQGYVLVLILDSELEHSYPKDNVPTRITKMTPSSATPAIQIKDTANPEDRTIKLKSPISLNANAPLLIGTGSNLEIGILETTATNTDTITLKKKLKHSHAADTEIKNLTSSSTEVNISYGVKQGMNILPIDASTDSIANTNRTNFPSGSCIRIEHGSTGPEYFIIGIGPSNIKEIWLEKEVKYSHASGSGIQQLVPAIEIKAANPGAWGDDIKIKVKPSNVLTAKVKGSDQNTLELDTVTGMEKGTILSLPTSPSSINTVQEVIKKGQINRVILRNNAQLNIGDEVSIVEFDITASFKELEENFKNLSMNPDHSRYIKKVITPKTSQLITIVGEPDPTSTLYSTNDNVPTWKLNEGDNGIPTGSEFINMYVGIDSEEPKDRTGLYTFKNIDEINFIAIPGISDRTVQDKLITHCGTDMKDRFAVLDPIVEADLDLIQEQRNFYDSKYAAIYYPWLRVFDPLSQTQINVPPSGHICGIYARSDTERGVHKAPANENINGILGLEKIGSFERVITKGQQDILNPKGINCIRSFPGRGIRVWGARTISSDSLWKYVNVRRLFLYIEESIDEGTQWVVFEPNDEKLWARVKQTITQFLTQVWTDGALMGTTPEQAFYVKCDRSTMTQNDIDNGRLIVQIGVAPVKPAEFVIFRIAQWTAGAKS